MEILSNSTSTNHGEVFASLCRKADEFVLVSPFCYSDFSPFADAIASCCDIHRVVFITSLKTEEVARIIDALISFRDEMNCINVQWGLHADNHLHGKIYIFKKNGCPFAGIITSANLTNNGMVANHEWGCLIEDEKLLESLEKQVLEDNICLARLWTLNADWKKMKMTRGYKGYGGILWRKEESMVPSDLAIGRRIYMVRGEQVMIDRDLSELYGVENAWCKREGYGQGSVCHRFDGILARDGDGDGGSLELMSQQVPFWDWFKRKYSK